MKGTLTIVPSFFLTLRSPVQVISISIALPAMWLLARDGATLLFGGTARPNPSTISCAPALLLAASPWSHSMSTPAIAVAADGLLLSKAMSHDQWNR